MVYLLNSKKFLHCSNTNYVLKYHLIESKYIHLTGINIYKQKSFSFFFPFLCSQHFRGEYVWCSRYCDVLETYLSPICNRNNTFTFGLIPLEKVLVPFFGLNSTNTILLQGEINYWVTIEGLFAIKPKNQTKPTFSFFLLIKRFELMTVDVYPFDLSCCHYDDHIYKNYKLYIISTII